MSGGLAKKSADASKAAAEKGKLDQLKEEEENNSDDSEGEEEEIMEKTPQKVVSTPQKPIQFNPASPQTQGSGRRESIQRKATGFKQFQMSAGLGKKSAALHQ